MKDKIFKWIYPWFPSALVIFLLIAAATDFGRVTLSEDPEITFANSETISNATDGTIIINGIVKATKFNAGTASALDTFGYHQRKDTVINTTINYTSVTSHSIIVCGWYDTTSTFFRDFTLGGGAKDTTAALHNIIMPGGDTAIFYTIDTLARAGEIPAYWYVIFE